MKIEKGVPIPSSKRGIPGGGFRESMEVGDSYLCPSGTKQSSASSSAIRWAKDRGYKWKFTTRQQPDGTIRVWRIK